MHVLISQRTSLYFSTSDCTIGWANGINGKWTTEYGEL